MICDISFDGHVKYAKHHLHGVDDDAVNSLVRSHYKITVALRIQT